MTFYILGIITGLLLAILALIALNRYHKEVESVVQKVEEIGEKKEDAEFFEPIEAEAEAIASVIKDNEGRGRDTPLNEL